MNADHYQKRAKNRLVVASVIVCAVGAGYFYFANYFSLSEVSLIGNSVEQFATTAAVKSFLAPPPLRNATSTPAKRVASQANAPLTIEGDIAATNAERAKKNLPALVENHLLDAVATLRLADMFTKQYFAHVSPSGESALTVASSLQYTYLAIGENLALGIFKGDADVVTAWMNSPGHRANILSTHYTEMGVAVGKGVFEGETTWIAVQIFGRPSTACPAPDAKLKAAIDAGQAQLNQMATDLSNADAEINAMDPKYGQAYNDKVAAYNALVAQYNTLAAQVKAQISQYNTSVKAFNACLG